MHMGCGVATTVRLTGGNHVGRMPLALEQALGCGYGYVADLSIQRYTDLTMIPRLARERAKTSDELNRASRDSKPHDLHPGRGGD